MGRLRRHGIRPRRSLGQHFLVDPNVVRKTVALAELAPGDRVVEVGAGTGTLTRALVAAGARVRAYEVDARLRPVLDEVVAGTAEVRIEDALDANLAASLEDGPWVLVANLPYHVGTPLLLDLLRHAAQVERFVVMVQREVADRLTARPGSREYGIPSVVVGLYAVFGGTFRVPSRVFYPPPKVESAVIRLDRGPAPSPDLRERAVELAQAAFGQRRKMLRSSLAAVLTDPGAIGAAGVAGTARPQDLAPGDYVRLAEAEADAR